MYGVYTVKIGRETTKYTVIYGVYIRFWPTLITWLWYSIQPRTFEFAAGMGMDGNHGNSTCTHQHLASQRNSIYSTKLTRHFQLLPCTWTLDAINMFEVLTQTQFKVIFCSYSLPAGAPSTRPRSTQYVGRRWHHDSAVATVNPCSVSVPVQYHCSRLYRPDQ